MNYQPISDKNRSLPIIHCYTFTLNQAGSTAMASNKTSMPCGYDYPFVDEQPEEYICAICIHAMRKPVQTNCGHRFCKECLDVALTR